MYISIGVYCGDYIDCKYGRKCRYRHGFRLHNFNVAVRRFFEYRLHIKLPILLTISRRHERLSGTKKCPKHMSRNYTCFDCKHQVGLRECEINYAERKGYIPEDGWSKFSRCGSFEKCSWADDYKELR